MDITRYLLVRGASSFDLSPDGRTLVYQSNVTGDPQVWSAPAAGGWATQLTFGSGVDSSRTLPDGSVLYGADSAGDERQGYYVLSPDGRRERLLIAKSEAFREIGDVSTDGRVVYASTERNGRDFDIHVADLATGASKLVYQGAFGFFPVAWQPGGPLVVVAETRGEDANDLHLLNVESGKLETLFKPKVAAAFDGIEWLPDGSGFYVATNLDREFSNLAFYDLKTRKLRFEATEPHDVTGVSLTGDGRYLAWVTEVEGYSRLTVLDRTTGRKLPAPDLPAGVYGISFAKKAPVLGIMVRGAQSAGEVFTWDLSSGALARPVAASWAGLDPASMVTPEAVTFKARDGGHPARPVLRPEARARRAEAAAGAPPARRSQRPRRPRLLTAPAVFRRPRHGRARPQLPGLHRLREGLRPAQRQAPAGERARRRGRRRGLDAVHRPGRSGQGRGDGRLLRRLPDQCGGRRLSRPLRGRGVLRRRQRLGEGARGRLAGAEGLGPPGVRRHRQSVRPGVLRLDLADQQCGQDPHAAPGPAWRQRPARPRRRGPTASSPSCARPGPRSSICASRTRATR
ncbi:hypothetical protein LRS04_01760 [Phenylobacterium sp. J367]|nr:hypothetical protein [Phenylobacterium sp. J367]MCR5877241.1 hypothetical protein [Phenylobacterium sp. J367]